MIQTALRVLSFAGSHRDIGRAYGESLRAEIHELYQKRLRNAIVQARRFGGRRVSEAEVRRMARACIEPTAAYHPAGMEELRGIAEGAAMDLEAVVAMNGLTDIRDALSWGGQLEALGGCTAFIVQGDRTQHGRPMVGQTWDLATDNMPHVIGVRRKPVDAPETFCLTTVGCLSLIGLNEHGMAVGTTNIRTRDARPGVTYLSILHRALHAERLPDARAAFRDAQRAGAHFYYLADRAGTALAIETTPHLVDEQAIERGAYVHTNHCLVEAHQALEANTPSASSHARKARLETLLDQGLVDTDTLKRYLGDTENGENAVCRDDTQGISSNGAAILDPVAGTIEACQGLPDRSRWVELTSY